MNAGCVSKCNSRIAKITKNNDVIAIGLITNGLFRVCFSSQEQQINLARASNEWTNANQKTYELCYCVMTGSTISGRKV